VVEPAWQEQVGGQLGGKRQKRRRASLNRFAGSSERSVAVAPIAIVVHIEGSDMQARQPPAL